MILEQKNFVFRASLKTVRNLIKLSCTSLAHQKHLNGFRCQKSFTRKSCAQWTLLSPNHWQILFKIPAMHYWYRPACCFSGPFSSAECLCSTSWFNSCSLTVNLQKIETKSSKPRCWVKLKTLHQSKPRCWGKLGTLHRSKPQLWCSNFRYREFPQEFPETIGTFWVVFGLRQLTAASSYQPRKSTPFV